MKSNKTKTKKGPKSPEGNRISSSKDVGKILFVLCILLIGTWWIYSGASKHEFVNWDDQVYAEEQNMVLQKDYKSLWTTPVSLNYHPLTMISLAVQAPDNPEKLSAKPFIQGNIILHILNAFLVFFLSYLLLKKNGIAAFIIAAIFAWHPMHVESVAWVSERKDVLYTFFFLSGLIAYRYYLISDKKRWIAICFLLFVASVLSKAMAVVFPLVMVLLDYWQGIKIGDMRRILQKLPFFAISLLFGLIALDVQSGNDFYGFFTLNVERTTAVADMEVFSILERFQFAAYGILFYLWKFFVPIQLSPFYPYPTSLGPIFWIGPIVVIGLFFLIWYSMKKTKIWAFGFGFYLVTIALVLQFISVGLAITADRYTYLPYFGISFALVAATLTWANKTSPTRGQIMSYGWYAFVAILLIIAPKQVKIWENSEKLWTQALSVYPDSDLALANRGNYLGKSGRIEEAIEDFEKASKNGTKRWDVYEGLGNCYGSLSNREGIEVDARKELLEESMAMFKRALELNPNKGNVWFNLGITQMNMKSPESINSLQKALTLMPNKEDVIRRALGYAYLIDGQYEASIKEFDIVIDKFNLKTDDNYTNRGIAKKRVGDIDGGRQDFMTALSINPNNPIARQELN
jgi:protein O-mannosyl-transferase